MPTFELPARPTRNQQVEGILFPLAESNGGEPAPPLARLRRGGADDLEFTSVQIDGTPA